jgi:hypothetical protein
VAKWSPNHATHPLLPKDRDSHVIQTLAPDDESVVELPIQAGNNRVALPAECEVVEVSATNECRMAFGDSSVDATVGIRRIFPIGVAVYRVPPGITHVAITNLSGSNGFVTVTRLY